MMMHDDAENHADEDQNDQNDDHDDDDGDDEYC